MCTLAAASTRPEKLVLRLQSRAPSADCVFVPSAAAAHDATGSVLAPPAHHHHPMKPGPSIVLQDLIDRHNTNAQNGKSPSAYMYKTSGRLGGAIHSLSLVSSSSLARCMKHRQKGATGRHSFALGISANE